LLRPAAAESGSLRSSSQDQLETSTLQINVDIENETAKQKVKDREALDLARTKNPFLFKVYDERQSLKFKQERYICWKAKEKLTTKHTVFKHLK